MVNTGYYDGFFSLPSGKKNPKESPEEAAIREVQEEVGVSLTELIPLAEMITTQGAEKWKHYFFTSRSWEGTVRNLEPNKCSRLGFFTRKDLPENMIPYVRQVCEDILSFIDNTDET